MHLSGVLKGMSGYFTRGAVVALACAALVFIACGGGDGGDAPTRATGGTTRPAGTADVSGAEGDVQTIEIAVRWASADAKDLRSLVQSSDEVFTARVERIAGTREESIAPGSGRSSIPVAIYELAVTKSFIGGRAVGSSITFEQVGGIVEQDGVTVRLMLEGDPPVEVGTEYVFFASMKQNGTLSAPPYSRLEVTSEGALVALAEWANLGALQQLSRVSADGLDSEIETAAQ